MYLSGCMESLNPELALYGSKNESSWTNTVLPPISEVSTDGVSLRPGTTLACRVPGQCRSPGGRGGAGGDLAARAGQGGGEAGSRRGQGTTGTLTGISHGKLV